MAYCCSQYGYCGTSDVYCGAGCLSAFGKCNSASSATSAASTSQTATPTGNDHGSPNAAATVPAALAFYTASPSSGGPGYASHATYNCYTGGAQNFPAPSSWVSYNTLWAFQVNNALKPIGDSDAEITAISNAIVSVAQTAMVDARVILAVVITESTGNVRVGCTNNGVENCGLMQSYDPVAKAYDPNNMQASITQMVRDGTQGTINGPGIVQDLNDPSTNGNLWAALRTYNSGSYNPNDISDARGATASYVSDIANYLQGWQGYGSANRDGCAW